MKAVICSRYGQPEVLKIKNINKPQVNDKQVLIKVYASAVTASDTYIRKLEAPGKPTFLKKQIIKLGMRAMLGFLRPRSKVIGFVLSGEIIELGSKVKNYQLGDQIFGLTDTTFGAYAEYKLLSQDQLDQGGLIKKPKSISHEEAAAIAYGGILATYFMKPKDILANDKVLVYGASGAAGTAAIQLAKARGAEVTAVCSHKNFDLVKSLGADQVLDYNQTSHVNKLKKYNRVFDAVGAKKTSEIKTACKVALSQGGLYLSVDQALMHVEKSHMSQLADAIKNHHIKAVIDKSFTLEQIVEAHKYVDSGHKKGNVTITL